MKRSFILSALLWPVFAFSQKTANDGDWKSYYASMANTPEAQYMVRFGDIDNLGFGWPGSFNPFSGRSTPSHEYPWRPRPGDSLGLDMIMIPTSMGTKDNGCGGDGYSGEYDFLKEKYGKTNFEIHFPLSVPKETIIKSAIIQMFVDDFQATVWCAKYEATINGKQAPFLAKAINALNQTGPIGKLISVSVPDDLLGVLKEKEFRILIDDPSTGANDGFAIDFIKILINPVAAKMAKGTIKGTVMNPATGKPMAGAVVMISDAKKATTDANGQFVLTDVTAGLAVLHVTAKGFADQSFTVDVEENKPSVVKLELKTASTK